MTEMPVFDAHDEFRRAELFLDSGRPAEAASILEPIVDAGPGDEASLELLARAYFGSAQLQRAEATLTQLVEVSPSHAWGRRALARTMERLSRHDEAAVHHRMADALGAA